MINYINSKRHLGEQNSHPSITVEISKTKCVIVGFHITNVLILGQGMNNKFLYNKYKKKKFLCVL